MPVVAVEVAADAGVDAAEVILEPEVAEEERVVIVEEEGGVVVEEEGVVEEARDVVVEEARDAVVKEKLLLGLK